MFQKGANIKVVGIGLAVLYAVSLGAFWQYLPLQKFQSNILIFIMLFALLFIGALAVIALQEWGRKLIIVANLVLFLFVLCRYIPRSELLPLSYLFISFIIFLYFMQDSIRGFFVGGRNKVWKSILVIDDDEIHLRTIRPILINSGYSVLTANSGEEGLTIAKNQKPDLILLDVILPGLKGREVCKQLKENDDTKHIPVVFLTAKDSLDDINAEKAIGAVGHLTKPINVKMLLETVKGVFQS